MNYNLLTSLLIIGSTITWIVWDVILASKGQQTESMLLRFYAKEHTWLPHFIGFLIGHWFFYVKSPVWKSGWMLALPVWIVLALWDHWWNTRQMGTDSWFRYAGLWTLIGIVSGMLLWPQRDNDAPF